MRADDATPGKRLETTRETSAALLVDSDVFVLFAAVNAIDRVISSLGFAWQEARRLEALKGMLLSAKRFKDLSSWERQNAVASCDRMPPLTESPKTETLQRLTGIANIDAGEAILFAWCHDHPSAVLLTGDKAALRALAKSAPGFAATLSGRVVCLEQVLRSLVRANGVAATYALLASRVRFHKTLTVCFSEVNRIDNDLCLAALQAYITEIASGLPTEWLRPV